MSSRSSEESRASGVACLACRNRHSKCDAGQPRCGRCVRDGRDCVYVASRRGYRGPGRPSRIPPIQQQSSTTNGVRLSPTTTTDRGPYTLTPSTSEESRAAYSASVEVQSPLTTDDRRHIELYYKNFHHCHPILLPQRFLHLRPWPPYLRAIVDLVGAQFCVKKHDCDFTQRVEPLIDACTDRSIEVVQARLLASILLHGRAQPAAAAVQLEKAIDLAIELCMHHEWFAAGSDPQQPLVCESARRTWWEIYTMDGVFAGFHHRPSFRTDSLMADTLLPCDELLYSSGGAIAGPLTFQHLRRRAFFGDDHQLSSFALRIEAVSILGRVLKANAPGAELGDESIQGLDALLSSWLANLPNDKVEISDTCGKFDEPLFQAQMIIQMATIYLHLPRCKLFTFKSATDVACARANNEMAAFMSRHMHSHRAMCAARSLSTLASARFGIGLHSPFFVCALVLIAVVHLSAAAAQAHDFSEWHTDRISQSLGLLKLGSRTWPLAAKTHDQLKKIALAVSDAESVQEDPIATGASTLLDFDSIMSDFWWTDGLCSGWPQSADAFSSGTALTQGADMMT